MFASWYFVWTKRMQIQLGLIWSLIKCRSISTNIILSCCIGSCALLMATLLSQKWFIGPFSRNPNSSSNFFNHRSSQILLAIEWNFSSALDLATTNCFLLRYVIRLSQTKEQYLKVDLWSVKEPTQFASEYVVTASLWWS